MRAIIPYYGGKQRLSGRIVRLLPVHTLYAEPFAGGCAVLFKKPHIKIVKYIEAINDHDERLVNFYRMVQRKPDELINVIQNTLYSESEHKLSNEILKNLKKFSEIERAWAYYVNISQGFGARLNTGWKRNMTENLNVGVWVSRNKILGTLFARMKNVQVSCTKALNFIDIYDQPSTCFYCDPPYPNAYQGHYGGYTLNDYQNLIDKLDKIKGSFVLSNYEQPKINIPDSWDKFEVDTRELTSSGAKKNQKRTEVIFRRFNSENFDKKIQKILKKKEFNIFCRKR